MFRRSNDAERLLAFFRGTGTDGAGRRLEDILSWDDDALEYHHDYIQWVFPLREPSSVHPEAPLVTEEVEEEFHRDPALREALRRAFDRMLGFYGLEMREAGGGSVVVEPGPAFATRRGAWLRPNNHNHLRLTRIMTSLSLLGLREKARALQRCLLDIAKTHPDWVTRETEGYWSRAVR